MLTFTNNSGPLFIVGTVGIGFFKNTSIGIILFVTHVLACLTVGFIFRWWKYSEKRLNKNEHIFTKSIKTVSVSNLGEVLADSIMSSINIILLIGGFIVLFSVIISILQSSKILNLLSSILSPITNTFGINTLYSNGIITGLLEITNGISNISSIQNKAISINIIICAFLLGFGGFSIMLQVFSVISKAKISIKPYLIGKLLQGIFAAIYTYFFLKIFYFLNLDL